ncbi:LacI family DNA-binding transcriptional regulator [Enterocloster citroniae]|jgi:LacI family transcriptional regulator|uniref:LacI family DNA-binding transcriptional regulator n=2 Tax=Bacillati TaxID=1783272 RepID=UPI001D05F4B5|nr:LacI family DNA-binding transcriptional regulator [Enterocloster citroniae]MCB7066391.1 LacI family transcriptional regulator [Enterocloster citroniae]MCD8276777.1 LacI family transcriptional regulator [Enterocloster citroniae]
MNSKKNNITIYDIAKAAEVSPGTVSRYINGVGTPREESRLRIEKAIQDFNYVPNRAARALKSKKNNIICLAYPETDNPFFFNMVAAVETETKRAGYSLMIYHTHGEISEELHILSLMNENIADGLFLINFNYSPEHFEAFNRVTCPLVISSLCISPYGGNDTDNFDYVGIDVRTAEYLATMHLINNGHKKIALIGGDKNIDVFKERYEGYCSALNKAGIPLRTDYCLFGKYDKQAGYEAGAKIAQMEDRPTAVCAVSDVMAIGAMRAFRENSVVLPDEIALVGMDNIDFTNDMSPRMSSIKMMQDEVGRCAVKIILDRIEGDVSPRKKIIYQPELVVRESSSIIKSTSDTQ